ncbi:response regulator transcription factor [Sphingobacterium olei]|uniref:Response regulator transcription factor n=1 Tax=Sphingobacterium olei TaxID=2571155 RepID=A0A4U0PIX8_9SPHI|nr:LytTR family DNA-binding domain-containing protein [Sphingobacterium olei]TJZ62854.1 response regulator transcription factor [Sphingobacterium olei]
MNRIRTILIEDEPLAKGRLEKLIKKIGVLELLGSFENPGEAMETMRTGQVDLVFSDIQMPEMDGISFLKSLAHPPFIVFITAHPEYATEGFDLDVLDYIMKPLLTEERLLKSIEKVQKALSYSANSAGHDQSIKIKDRNKTEFFKPSDILYVKAWGDYVQIFTIIGVKTPSYTMKDMEKMLPWKSFIRIQRSYIVNVEHIESVDAIKVILKNTKEVLPIGLGYRTQFFSRMGIKE